MMTAGDDIRCTICGGVIRSGERYHDEGDTPGPAHRHCRPPVSQTHPPLDAKPSPPIPESAPAGGVKYDGGKPRWDLLPWDAVARVVRVLTWGVERTDPKPYPAWNWQHVPGARERYFSAAQRHILAWWNGEALDPESRLPHLAHAVCCLLFLIWFDENREAP